MLAEEGAREQVVWSFWRKGRLYIVRANDRLTGETFVGYVLGQGRMGLRMGLIKYVPPLGPPCTLLLFLWLTGKVFALPRAPGDESVTILSRFPFTSRFMMLSGVTTFRWDMAGDRMS